MAFGGLAVVAYVLRFLWLAWRTGAVPGRLGAVHPAGDWHFTFSILAALLGVVLGLGCVYLGWRWIRQPTAH